MTEQDENLGYPAEWGTENFPHPNPFFPDVPRKTSGWPLKILLIIFPVIPLLLMLAGVFVDYHGVFYVAGFTLFLTNGIIGAYAFTLKYRSHRFWSTSPVIPAVVIESAESSGDTFASILGLAFGPLGLLYNMLRSRDGYRTATVYCFFKNRTNTLSIPLNDWWNQYVQGDYIWVAIQPDESIEAVDRFAPFELRGIPVSSETIAWLQHVMPHAKGNIKETGIFSGMGLTKYSEIRALKEQKQAAKANTRAIKRELKYGQTKQP